MTSRTRLTIDNMYVGKEVTLMLPMDVSQGYEKDALQYGLIDEIPAIVSDITGNSVVHFRRISHNVESMRITGHPTQLGEYVRHSCLVSEARKTKTMNDVLAKVEPHHFHATWDRSTGSWEHGGVKVWFHSGATSSVSWAEGAIHPSHIDSSGHVLDTEAVRQTTWFHASERADWGEALEGVKDAAGLPLMVHVGSEDAAITRMGDILDCRAGGADDEVVGWLFEVHLKDEAEIFEQTLEDIRFGWWQGWTPAIHGQCNVFGYMNDFESEDNDLSLYVRANMLCVVRSTPLMRQDVPIDVLEKV